MPVTGAVTGLPGLPGLLHGRAAEQEVIGRLIAQARAGRSGALVLRGEPGGGNGTLATFDTDSWRVMIDERKVVFA